MVPRFEGRAYSVLWWIVAVGPWAAIYVLQLPTWWFFVWFGIFACAFVPFLLIVGRRHNRAVDSFAARHGWQPLAADSSVAVDGTRAPFTRARPHRAVTVFSKAYGAHTVESYMLESGQKNSGLAAHVVQIRLPGQHAWMQVRDDTVPDEVAAAAGGQDLAMESEAFNRRFRVRSDDPRHATDVLAPLMMAHLLDQTWPEPVHSWSIDGGALLWWRDGLIDFEVIPAVADFLVGVVEHLPAYLLDAQPD